jgi:hypothetical protein
MASGQPHPLVSGRTSLRSSRNKGPNQDLDRPPWTALQVRAHVSDSGYRWKRDLNTRSRHEEM